MSKQPSQPKDDPSTAPESGTERDDTTGSPPADRAERHDDRPVERDDPSVAGEER